MTDFFELNTRSAFSFLSSGSQPQALAHRAADLSMPGAALIDRDSVAGAVRFHFEARARGIKPIIGSAITMEDGSLLSLVPATLRGYRNLSRLITTIKLRHPKGEHFATRADIEDHSQDLLCFTGGGDGFMHHSIKNSRGQADLAWLKYVFEDRIYIELQRHYLRNQEAVNQSLLGLAHKLRIPYFASNGACYADKGDRELFDVFTCIRNHCTIYEAGKLLSENGERYLKPKAQMLILFEDMPEAVEITAEIASRVDFSMDELSYQFPDYPVPPGETMDSYLRTQAVHGAWERYRPIFNDKKEKDVTPQKVFDQLNRELDLIEKKKLTGYFLAVWDISSYARKNRILSQGRGSAANSVACYALGITAVDPIKNKLLFERFLSEKHESYPDIDIDLPSGDDREQMIQYVYGKYSRRGAAMTANVISYRGRSAVREVGKVFGFDPDALGQLSRLNAYYETFTGEELNRKLKEAGFDPADNHRLQKFSDLYSRILNFPRHLGQHSGGMVVSWTGLDSVVPIEPASMPDRSIIQWDKDDCEELKLVKIDLLGLGMMAVLRDTIALIREHHGEEKDLYQIPKDDKTVYETLQKADTVGMFQVESRAQIAFLPKTKPENFYDIAVQVAIIRPGPIAGKMLSSYIKRRQKLEPITYPHPDLEENLKRTLGVPLFQEQLLKISMQLADFSGADAENLRRAMGFKRPSEKLGEITESLKKGMTKKGIDPDTQENIVKSVLAFSNYGFPESHAMSFALLAYASAYFMVHYRACFMAAMLNNYPLGFYSAATLIKDAQRHDLHFIAMDINRSQHIFTIEEVNGDKQVRVGLKYVKGLRKETGEAIVAEREANGFYTSVEDLVRRVPGINKREVRALSMAGTLNFDGTVHRREALWRSELAIQPTGDLFTNTDEANLDPAFLRRMEGLQLIETDLRKTGITIGKHPMAFIREEMMSRNILSAQDTLNLKKGDVVSVAGAVIIRQRPMTANEVVFITLEDETGFSNFVVMPDMFERFRAVINQNDYLIIKGIFEERGMLKALYFEPVGSFTADVAAHNFH